MVCFQSWHYCPKDYHGFRWSKCKCVMKVFSIVPTDAMLEMQWPACDILHWTNHLWQRTRFSWCPERKQSYSLKHKVVIKLHYYTVAKKYYKCDKNNYVTHPSIFFHLSAAKSQWQQPKRESQTPSPRPPPPAYPKELQHVQALLRGLLHKGHA